MGFNSGKALGGVIKTHLGFPYNFALGMLASMLTSLYAVVFLKDSSCLREERLSKEAFKDKEDIYVSKSQTHVVSTATNLEKFKKLFSLKNIQEGVR